MGHAVARATVSPMRLHHENFKQIENEHVDIYKINFLSRADLFIWTATNKVKLLAPFDPTNYAGHLMRHSLQPG